MSAPVHSIAVFSMTGYATLRIDIIEDASFTLTLKSVNHRFLDLQLRLPQSCDALEAPIRKLLKDHIQRGHVEFSLQLEREHRTALSLNHDQIAGYIAAFRAAAATHDLTTEPDLNEVLRLPGMISRQQPASAEDAGPLQSAILDELPNLLASFNASRAAEGHVLAGELRGSMSRIDTLAAEIGSLREGARAAAFDRLRARIRELIPELAPPGLAGAASPTDDRLLAEAALLVERSDIEEEIVRLRAHTAAFIALLEQGGPLGKRLDFLLQELNREANTLLSKTGGASSQNGLRITELGLEIKVEIERAREQIQNLE
jgi:uncharacterized protein (TIGR00255 family)